ncbi:MAG: L-glutamate gamma-semialdehyde dehydrogenase, partial [Zetaproteobacteria bacterium]|nr:L-glutamate gamma-semialdehyde dehydrogenase [Zetaproteobacteria bacterium]
MSLGIFQCPPPYNEPILNYKPLSPERIQLEAELQRQKSLVTEIPLIINGVEITASKPTFEVRCPHDHNHKLAHISGANSTQTQNAIRAAVEARKTWGQLPWEERAAVFLRAADMITGKYRSRMNAATMLGQSKTIHQAEIEAAAELADFYRFNTFFARQLYEQQPMKSPAGNWNRSELRPLEGFVYAIAPFNFTAISLNLAAAPALMGCGVVWKPAPTAALASYYGLKILEEAGLPPGVINMIHGDPVVLGKEIISHPDLAGIHFTGSTNTFQQIWKQVGENITQYKTYPRLVGETGGKDFVLADHSADTQSLITALIRGAFEFQGQKCSAASRAYIPTSLWKKIKSPLLEQAKSLAVGSPENYQNFCGAVIDERAFHKIVSYIEAAKQSPDAQILCGGEYDHKTGYFVYPTIIQVEDPHYKSMSEEIFGPVLSVYVYPDTSSVAEICELVDKSSNYALTGAIFACNRHVVKEMTDRLRDAAGNFYINDKPTGAVVGQQPFG